MKHTTIAIAAVAVAVALIAAAGILADALPPVIVTVCGGPALIGIIMLVALREGTR